MKKQSISSGIREKKSQPKSVTDLVEPKYFDVKKEELFNTTTATAPHKNQESSLCFERQQHVGIEVAGQEELNLVKYSKENSFIMERSLIHLIKIV